MRNRFDDALFIQTGACNGRGISRALTKAYDAAAESGTDASNKDHAARLILHQLCHLAGIWVNDHDKLDQVASGGFNYDIAQQVCIDRLEDEETLRVCVPWFVKEPRERRPSFEGLDYDAVLAHAMKMALAVDPNMSASRFAMTWIQWMVPAAEALRAEIPPSTPEQETHHLDTPAT